VKNKEEYLTFMKNTPNIIVPASFFVELLRLDENEGKFEMMVEQNQIFARGNSDKLTSRLINGNYPEYKQILPTGYEINITANREELIRAVKITSLVADTQNGEIKIKASSNKQALLISSESIDRGGNLSNVAAKIDGPEFEVIFNCRYLIDGLNIISNYADKILLKLNKKKSPMLMRGINQTGEEEKNLSYVVMPIIKD
jgi:DNA polymerase-3 subunit beta